MRDAETVVDPILRIDRAGARSDQVVAARPRDEAPSASASGFRPAGRRQDIDRAKALAILLVVLGHIPNPTSPAWASVLRLLIYNFHMPLFIYLSGYVYYMTITTPSERTFGAYLAGRANRLLVPFAFFAVLILNIKYFSGHIAVINRSNFDYWDGYGLLLFDTQDSPALDLWYLFTLFVFCAVSYPVVMFRKRFLPVMAVVSLGMYAVFAYNEPRGSMISDFYVDRLCWFYVFFTLGCFASAFQASAIPLMRRFWPLMLIGFAAAEYCAVYRQDIVPSGWRFLIVGCFAIAFIHGFMASFAPGLSRFTRILSENTMIIYLLNTMIIAVLQQGHMGPADPGSLRFGAFMMVSFAVAVMLPIAIRSAMKHIPPLSNAVRYVS